MTPRQTDILRYIDTFWKARGYCPSYGEIMVHSGYKSKSNVHRVVEALEERGFIKRIPHRARAIEVIKTPW